MQAYGYETPAVFTPQELFNQEAANSVLLSMQAFAAGARELYNQSRQDMLDFIKTYRDFVGEDADATNWYNYNTVGKAGELIDAMYANGIDPLRSSEGRSLISKYIATRPYDKLNSLKLQLANRQKYNEAVATAAANGTYDEDMERWYLNNKGLGNWSPIDENGNVRNWDVLAPIKYKSLYDLTSPLFENLQKTQWLGHGTGHGELNKYYSIFGVSDDIQQSLGDAGLQLLQNSEQGRYWLSKITPQSGTVLSVLDNAAFKLKASLDKEALDYANTHKTNFEKDWQKKIANDPYYSNLSKEELNKSKNQYKQTWGYENKPGLDKRNSLFGSDWENGSVNGLTRSLIKKDLEIGAILDANAAKLQPEEKYDEAYVKNEELKLKRREVAAAEKAAAGNGSQTGVGSNFEYITGQMVQATSKMFGINPLLHGAFNRALAANFSKQQNAFIANLIRSTKSGDNPTYSIIEQFVKKYGVSSMSGATLLFHGRGKNEGSWLASSTDMGKLLNADDAVTKILGYAVPNDYDALSQDAKNKYVNTGIGGDDHTGTIIQPKGVLIGLYLKDGRVHLYDVVDVYGVSPAGDKSQILSTKVYGGIRLMDTGAVTTELSSGHLTIDTGYSATALQNSQWVNNSIGKKTTTADAVGTVSYQ